VVMGPSDSDDWPAAPAGDGTRGFDSLFVGIFDTNLQTDYLRWISGSVHDHPTALAIHPSSYEVYIAGATNSTDFPETEGGIQESNAGLFDAFVARLRPDLSDMLQATYLGGYSGSEVEVSLAIDAAEGIYLTGRTNSGNRGTIDDDNWPIELMAPVATPQKDFGGGIEDLFVGLLNPELTVPRMVTYLGGNGIESSHVPRLLIHPSDGTVYVAGKTASDDADSDQGIQWSPGVFIARYTPEMDSLQSFATLTASDIDDILFHSSGSLYVLGTTADTLPTAETLDSLQDEFGGGFGDGFVASYDSNLVLTRATYLGGSDREGGQAFIEHPDSGALYVTGYTNSVDYPRTAGGAQSSNRGFQEGFVARLAADLSNRGESQSTYYGGSASDSSRVLAIDPDLGDVYIGGVTDSSDLLGMGGAAQPDSILDPEAFVALFDPTLAGGSAPEINVVPPSHDFGQVAVGSRSGPFELTIENIGTADLIIQTISNSDATNFILVANGGSNGCSPERPLVLAPAASCSFTAEFAPSAAASLAAEVTIESNDLDEGDLEVPLSGVGTSGNGGQTDEPESCGCMVPGGPAAPGPLSVLVGLGLVALAWRRLRRRVR
ncbi:MAG: choice-of-anchor D domain-containing protein, partial [Polyangiales bacterium]